MKVREEKFELRLPRDGKRSGGVHLSEVLRSLAFKTGVLDSKYDVPLDESNTVAMQMGLSWENYLAEHQHPEIKFHPKELKLDGIAMSPDGYSVIDDEDYADRLRVEPGSFILHEFKLTKKSSRDAKEAIRNRSKKYELWMWQIKAYRHALNKLLEEEGETPNGICKLHALYVNGNYSRDDSDPESHPAYKIFVLEFTQEELETNWAMVLDHKRFLDNEQE